MFIYVVVGAGRPVYVILNILLIFLEIVRLAYFACYLVFFGYLSVILIHPNYFSVMIFVSVTELTLTLNRPKNNSGELTDKYVTA